jgi:sodium/potassium/calcium exchanger 6
MALLLLLATNGWEGFNISLSKLPIFWLLILLGVLLSLLLFFLLHPSKPPHWAMQAVLGVAALLTSGAWLYLLAYEAVTLLNSFGVVFGIDTALLGLTVLAIGNSVGDWITNTAVSRSGHPEMGVASSFQSPLLRVILGLSVALLAEVSFHQHGRSIPVPIHAPGFSTVKLSWIFLGVSLFASAVVFPLCKFKPPMPYGVALIYVYITFIIFAVLDEVGVVKIALN